MNPEFERNLYLEVSLARIIAMPLCLAAIFALTYLSDAANAGNTYNYHQLYETTATTAIVLYVAIVVFWGARQSAESIYEELRNKTWDIQKTSAISAWELTWGKLFGSTLFNWYGGLICLLVFTLATPTENLLFSWIFALSGGIFIQSFSLLTSVFALRNKQPLKPSVSYGVLLFILLFLVPFVLHEYDRHDLIRWYGIPLTEQVMTAFTLCFGCIWMIVGVWRLLAQELQIRTLPGFWLGFLVFWVFYLTGFAENSATDTQNTIETSIYAAYITLAFCVVFTYIWLFLDDNNPMLARRIWVYAQQEQWQRVLEEMPCWVLNLIIALPLVLILSLFMRLAEVEEAHLYPLPCYLLMLRDAALILFFSYAPNPKRALGLSLLYLSFLYGVFPAIFMQMDSKTLVSLFLPLIGDNIFTAIVIAAIQTGVAGFFLFQRWQKTVNQV